MKKTFALLGLCVCLAFASPISAQTGHEPPLCGIGHMDYETGEFVCDDPDGDGQVNGIGHMDAPALADSSTVVVMTTLLGAAPTVISVTGL